MTSFRLVSLCAALVAATALDAAAQREAPNRDAVVAMPAGQVSLAQARSLPDFLNAASALPVAGPIPSLAFDFNAAALTARTPVRGGEPGQPFATADASDQALQLVDPALLEAAARARAAADGLSTVSPSAVGSQNLQFTTSQVAPSAVDTTFPVRATGKLWFEKVPGSGNWFVCSGSMIKPGIVVTAGHCVSSGAGSWFGSFQFVPSYRNGAAPYGAWRSWAHATTTTQWFSGGGGVPNGGDFAIIVFNRNSAGKRIGDYTGWLGYQYPSLVGRHVTVLGYPTNLDGGNVNHRIDAQTTTGSNSTGLWGSDMRGGSSGGGVVLNFAYSYASSTTRPTDNGENRLVSVVSYGPTAVGPMYQGGSIFDSRLQNMLNSACTSFSWAC